MNRLGIKPLAVVLAFSATSFSFGMSDDKAETVYAADEEEAKTVTLEHYIATGSRFTGTDTAFEPPLTEIDHEALERWGHKSAYTALLEQPFAYGYANSDTQSNGLTGSAGANLRGLGTLNTLTLINGRRAGGNSAVGFEHGGFADLNLIPVAAIREIEVAVDGTSVAYGSDAVAGTVNLLLYQDYIGNRVETSYSNTTDGDAAEKQFSFLTGQQLNDRTHLVLLGSWYDRNALFARDRDISETSDFRGQGGTNQRSDSFSGRINLSGQPLVLENGTAFPTSANDYTAYSRAEAGFNYNDYAPAVPALTQKSAMAHLTHRFTEQFEAWTELLYTETDFDNALAPAPWTTDFFPGVLTAVRNSPHRPSDIQGSDISRLSYRNEELGNLEQPSEKAAHRLLFGLRGDIGEWRWEAAVMQIKSRLDREISGIVDEAALIDVINSGRFNPFARSSASGINDGVAFDNAAALREAATTAHERFDEQYRSVDFTFEGPAFELPAGPLTTVFGAQYSDEEIDIDIDRAFLFPGIPGAWSNYSPYEAEREVFSFFGESIIPLLDESGAGGRKLNLQLAARYDDYTDESGAFKNRYNQLVYKAGFEFVPVPSLTLEGSFSTAFRAPTLNESFNTNFASLVYDTGTPGNPDRQRYTTQLSPNPDLDPEKSEVFNLGLSYEPAFAPNWTAGVRYYHIQTEDAINHNGQDLVDAGASGFIFATRFNTSELVTDGLEYEITYRHENEYGQWEAAIGVNQVLSYDIRPRENDAEIDFLGKLVHPLVPSENVQGPGSIPEYKGYARFLWSHDQLTLGGTVNYIHSLEDNANLTRDGKPREIDHWLTLDLMAQYTWTGRDQAWLSGTTLTLGIENVTDEAPPFAAGAYADGYDSSLYSIAGRRISLSLSKEF